MLILSAPNGFCTNEHDIFFKKKAMMKKPKSIKRYSGLPIYLVFHECVKESRSIEMASGRSSIVWQREYRN